MREGTKSSIVSLLQSKEKKTFASTDVKDSLFSEHIGRIVHYLLISFFDKIFMKNRNVDLLFLNRIDGSLRFLSLAFLGRTFHYHN